MADLEQNRQESLDLIQEEIDSMDVNTPLGNTIDTIDHLDHWPVINIEENFKEMCNVLIDWNETEMELVKTKLICCLLRAGKDIDYKKTTIELFTDDSGEKAIILRQSYEYDTVQWYDQYILRYKWDKWCYERVGLNWEKS